MSIQQVNTIVFERVYNRLIYCSFLNEVTENYLSVDLIFSNRPDLERYELNYRPFENLQIETEEKIKLFIKNLSDLNSLSYSAKYEEDFTSYAEFINFNNEHKTNAFQMLKDLTCILYNIEIDTIKNSKFSKLLTSDNEKCINALKRLISEAKINIIASLENYNIATWNK